MSIRILPFTSSLAKERFRTTLDDTTYEFLYRFNFRTQRWTMTIRDDAGNDLLTGIPIICNSLLLKNYQYNLNLPQGKLIAINLVEDGIPPTRETLGTDVIVAYEDAT